MWVANLLCACVSLRGTRNIKARRERPGCASPALNQRTLECAVCMRSSARSLIATAAATKTCVFANALEILPKSNTLLLLRPSWMPGIFRVQQLRPLDFICSGEQDEPTTRNIPELGILESIPLTEYCPFRERTPLMANYK